VRDLIINLAPTGMVPTRAMSPHVPITPDEIIADACACLELGAAIIHLHARDADGVPTHAPNVYARIIGGIREQHPDAILCVSLSGRNVQDFERRSAPLTLRGDVKPDMASLTLASLNFPGSASVNAPEMIARLATAMAEADIKPELEIFDLGMVNYARYLIDKGLISGPHYANILLGNIASAQALPLHLGTLVAGLPEGTVWAVGGVGSVQLTASTMGLLHGDGVRIGLEDYLWMDEDRDVPATNAALTERMVHLAATFGRPVATRARVRERLGL
jgi:uncharacterized protein (DUF849 family)